MHYRQVGLNGYIMKNNENDFPTLDGKTNFGWYKMDNSRVRIKVA